MDCYMQPWVRLMFFICPELSIILRECSNNEKCSLGTTKNLFPTLVVGVEGVCKGGGGTRGGGMKGFLDKG